MAPKRRLLSTCLVFFTISAVQAVRPALVDNQNATESRDNTEITPRRLSVITASNSGTESFPVRRSASAVVAEDRSLADLVAAATGHGGKGGGGGKKFHKGFYKGHNQKVNKGHHHDHHHGRNTKGDYEHKAVHEHGGGGKKGAKGSKHKEGHKAEHKKGAKGGKGKKSGKKGKFHKGHHDKGFKHHEEHDAHGHKEKDGFKKQTGKYGSSYDEEEGYYKKNKGKKHDGGKFAGGTTWNHKGGDSFSVKGKYHEDYSDIKGKFGYHGKEHHGHEHDLKGGHKKGHSHKDGDHYEHKHGDGGDHDGYHSHTGPVYLPPIQNAQRRCDNDQFRQDGSENTDVQADRRQFSFSNLQARRPRPKQRPKGPMKFEENNENEQNLRGQTPRGARYRQQSFPRHISSETSNSLPHQHPAQHNKHSQNAHAPGNIYRPNSAPPVSTYRPKHHLYSSGPMNNSDKYSNQYEPKSHSNNHAVPMYRPKEHRQASPSGEPLRAPHQHRPNSAPSHYSRPNPSHGDLRLKKRPPLRRPAENYYRNPNEIPHDSPNENPSNKFSQPELPDSRHRPETSDEKYYPHYPPQHSHEGENSLGHDEDDDSLYTKDSRVQEDESSPNDDRVHPYRTSHHPSNPKYRKGNRHRNNLEKYNSIPDEEEEEERKPHLQPSDDDDYDYRNAPDYSDSNDDYDYAHQGEEDYPQQVYDDTPSQNEESEEPDYHDDKIHPTEGHDDERGKHAPPYRKDRKHQLNSYPRGAEEPPTALHQIPAPNFQPNRQLEKQPPSYQPNVKGSQPQTGATNPDPSEQQKLQAEASGFTGGHQDFDFDQFGDFGQFRG